MSTVKFPGQVPGPLPPPDNQGFAAAQLSAQTRLTQTGYLADLKVDVVLRGGVRFVHGQEFTGSLELLRNCGAVLTERFFDRLFRDYPSTRAFLESLDQAAQQRMVLSAIALIADLGQNAAQLDSYVLRLGRRHLDYGATPQSLHAVVTTLLLTIAELLEGAWTEQTAAAWREAASRLASVMLRALEQPADHESVQGGLQG